MTTPLNAPVTLRELHDLGNGYLTRDLSPGRVELYRADGFSFGDTGVEYLEQVIRHDQDRPVPSTGETIKQRFDDPKQPNSAIAADDVAPEAPAPPVAAAPAAAAPVALAVEQPVAAKVAKSRGSKA